MKALKLFLLTIFAALGLAAQAQTIEVYKDGQVIDSFSAAQVDSVVYKQVAATPKYYYYVGTVKPTAENLTTIGTAATEPVTSIELGNDGTVYKWFVYPNVWGKPTFIDPSNNMECNMTNFDSVYPIENYTVLRAGKTGIGTLNITWK